MNCIKIFIENNLHDSNKLSNILPELSASQREVVMLYSVGFTIKKIGHMKNVSHFTVKNTLTLVKNKLGVFSLEDIRSIVLLRILVNYPLECKIP